MAKSVKSCDYPTAIAVKVFEMLNPGKIKVEPDPFSRLSIITETEPKDLIYPEGWYYAKGSFRNKHTSTTGVYDEIPMRKPAVDWGDVARYCTLE